ncbi:hypothetical protein Fmac_005730 [Flemingia macrophylla]|uniref:Uncharacterized protein n=1 Tax=Flemingia macrophylla TaxID=520843 RepID=A0ABD1N8K9_9FABA
MKLCCANIPPWNPTAPPPPTEPQSSTTPPSQPDLQLITPEATPMDFTPISTEHLAPPISRSSSAAPPASLRRPSDVPLPPLRRPSTPDLRNPTYYTPAVGYCLNPDWIVRRVSHQDTLDNAPPYLVYADHLHKEIVLAMRCLNLAKEIQDNGFDVWVANMRGTKYSRQHTSLPSNSSYVIQSLIKLVFDIYRFDHIVLSYTATSDHGIIWIEKDAEKALQVSDQESAPTNGTNSQREEGSG